MAEPDDVPVELGRVDEADVEEAEDNGDDDEDAPSEEDFVPKPTRRLAVHHSRAMAYSPIRSLSKSNTV